MVQGLWRFFHSLTLAEILKENHVKLIIDVSYQNNKAKVVGGFFENWNDEQFLKINENTVNEIQEYIPGEFYKRELPCILEFLNEFDLNGIEFIIIDGFTYLNDNYKKGLGAYLFENLNKTIPIIGVAKSKFYDNTKNVIEIFRGESKNPLYVSSIGLDLLKAATLIKNMHGNHRLPHLIKLVDTQTKKL